MCNLAVKWPDAGSGNGVMKFYTAAHALLATLTLNKPALADPVDGVSALNNSPILSFEPSDDGLCDYAKVEDSDALESFKLSVGATGSGEDVEVPDLDFETGTTITVDTGSITFPAGSS